jgi:hypothetical protein
MKTMTKGTTTYTEALIEANDKARELLETYDGLKYHIENGLIVIDKDSLEDAQKEELKNLGRA